MSERLTCHRCGAAAEYDGEAGNWRAYEDGWRLEGTRPICPACAALRLARNLQALARRKWKGRRSL